jgi:hypothetical protein
MLVVHSEQKMLPAFSAGAWTGMFSGKTRSSSIRYEEGVHETSPDQTAITDGPGKLAGKQWRSLASIA